MLILSSISSSLEFWLVNHISMYENSKSNVSKNINFFGEISSNWPNDLLGGMYARLLNHVDNHCWQCYNITSVISKRGAFSPSSSLVILLLVLPSNFNVSRVKSSRWYPMLILNVILFSI